MCRLLPLRFAGRAHGHLLYKGNCSAPQMNTRRSPGNSVHEGEGNLYANQTLALALSLRMCDQSQLVARPAVPLASVRAMLTLRHDVVVVPQRDSA